MIKYTDIFNDMHPDFFQKKNIVSLPKEQVLTELVTELSENLPSEVKMSFPVTFGEYKGDISLLREAVKNVDEDWVQWYNGDERAFCAFDKENIVSFCLLSDMGEHRGKRIGGPGCVGTVPKYRGHGIGLEMVRLATKKFKEEGFDISWIHYTHIAHWYMKLGYKPVLRWNSGGIISGE